MLEYIYSVPDLQDDFFIIDVDHFWVELNPQWNHVVFIEDSLYVLYDQRGLPHSTVPHHNYPET